MQHTRINQQASDSGNQLQDAGWARIPNAFSLEECEQVWLECRFLESLHYNEENLQKRSVYLSDQTEARVSYAMMVAKEESDLPFINLDGFGGLESVFENFSELSQKMVGVDPSRVRSLLNWQSYETGSKPIPWHFDGEYFQFEKTAGGFGLEINEALMSPFVFLMVISNENEEGPQGVELLDLDKGEVIRPPSRAGDILVFNNFRFKHRVPMLNRARRIIGLRCFDVGSGHFVSRKDLQRSELKYHARQDNGFIAGDIDPISLQKEFLSEKWPKIWADCLKDGAAF